MRVRLLTPGTRACLAPDGTASVEGIIDFLWAETFPFTFALDILVAFEIDAGESGDSWEPTIEVIDADGVLRWRARLLVIGGSTGADGARWVRYVALPVVFTADGPGEHEIRVVLAGEQIAALSLSVVRRVAAVT